MKMSYKQVRIDRVGPTLESLGRGGYSRVGIDASLGNHEPMSASLANRVIQMISKYADKTRMIADFPWNSVWRHYRPGPQASRGKALFQSNEVAVTIPSRREPENVTALDGSLSSKGRLGEEDLYMTLSYRVVYLGDDYWLLEILFSVEVRRKDCPTFDWAFTSRLKCDDLRGLGMALEDTVSTLSSASRKVKAAWDEVSSFFQRIE